MTKAEWLKSTDPGRLLKHVFGTSLSHYLAAFVTRKQPRAKQRRMRLFLCACCRDCSMWETLGELERQAVEVAERYADGVASRQELKTAFLAAEWGMFGQNVPDSWWRRLFNRFVLPTPWADINPSDDEAVATADVAIDMCYVSSMPWRLAESGQCEIIRDIFGNPFRALPPVNPDVLRWNDATVSKLATGIYADSAFDRLPILADALEDAGCDNADLLSHCRSPGPHVRGCWAVDLLLGKA
jgi:hypothetical protein